MQPAAITQTDRASEVAPAIRPTAAWRVASVEVLPQGRLRVSFVDGTVGEVEMWRFLQGTGVVGTVFEPLRDPGFLAQVAIVSGAVTWPNGADLAPDAMYDAIRAQGVWSLE
jgi:Protein of unknown function (DUF2442)